MYAIHKQVHKPTGIEQSLYSNFFSTQEKSLVVSGVNQLHVYRLNPDIESGTKEKVQDGPKPKKCKLELLASFSLFGNIVSMQNVKLAGNTRDSLLLGFKEAKLSLVDYDPSTHDLKTSSLHYFEEEDLKDGLMQHAHHEPIVRVDPEGRCAAMLIYGNKLVILPFRKETSSDEEPGGSGKSSVLSSYIIDTRHLDEKVTNIIDLQFLYGYYEPTLFILYEPLPTWAGRVAVRKDTCSIVAISLNIQEKVHPIIWSLEGLPFDCAQVIPIPKPIGGVLIFAVNSLTYMNQSVPPYGVSLNSLTDFSTEFLLKQQEGVKIMLDCAQAAMISNDKLVISLKGGELYVLTLMVDGMRAVKRFNFDKAAASVLTTSMCHCEEGYIFLGSRLGNSLLLKYTEKDTKDVSEKTNGAAVQGEDKSEEPPAKRLMSESDLMASDVSQLDDLDELEVYLNTESNPQTGSQITSYTFEVADSIMNIGPCGQMVMGEPAFLSEEFSNSVDPDIELVATSGHGKNGALAVVQNTVRPQVVTTFELPGCSDMWTVYGPSKPNEEGDSEEETERSHAFLILSKDDMSMVLQTGQEIMELDHSGFQTSSTTVYAANIGDNKYILQVTPHTVSLMEGVNEIQNLTLELGAPIVYCTVADPYALLLTEEGDTVLLVLKPVEGSTSHKLVKKTTNVKQGGTILAMCAYTDVSGLFTTEVSEVTEKPPEKIPKTPTDGTPLLTEKTTVDDEDELLYGDSDISMTVAPGPTAVKEEPKTEEPMETDAPPKVNVTPTHWAAVARVDGSLEIYSMPDFKVLFEVKHFAIGNQVLVDSDDPDQIYNPPKPGTELPSVKELLIVGMGNKKTKPYLMARVGDDFYIYETFKYQAPGETNTERLRVRFKKYQHDLILKEKKTAKFFKRKTATSANDGQDENKKQVPTGERLLRIFDDISGYSGVFLCGSHPHWLFMSPRCALRIHPQNIDGRVTCFAPFHNVNCPKGFLYFNKQGELRISVLPTHLMYDTPWPVRKVPVRCTPHKITYDPESKIYAVVTSFSEMCNKYVSVQGEGEKEFEVQERDDRFIYPMIERYNVQLFSPVTWEAIPNTKFEFEEFEHVTDLKYIALKSEGTVSGLKGYISVCTNFSHGEEVTSRGKLYIWDIIEVVPEPGQPLTKNKLKSEYNKEQKGPVTAVDSCRGYMISAVGQKIYIWQFTDGDLSGIAFIDTQIYIHTITTLKNMILIGDISKSVSLLRLQEDHKVLSLVSRDMRQLECYSCAFLVDNNSLCFLVSDREKNFLIYTYQPEMRESQGGQRLLRRGDFNTGVHVNTFFRIRCRLSDPSIDKKSVEKKHSTFYASLDGSIGFILPITEKTYRRLLMLQNALNVQLPHTAGLNPKAYRQVHIEQKQLQNVHRNILDGDLLWRFLYLSSSERSELAKRIGTSNDQLVDDLMEIDRLTCHF